VAKLAFRQHQMMCKEAQILQFNFLPMSKQHLVQREARSCHAKPLHK
jgi:hypothetical protein